MIKILTYVSGLILGFLLLLLTGCAATPIVETRNVEIEVPVHVKLPPELIEPVYLPELPNRALVNDDLLDHIEQLYVLFDQVNARFEIIRRMQPK